MVVISAPLAATARVRQELTRRPSTSTVQAPHWPWSQPFLLPVRSRCSRRSVEQRGAGVDGEGALLLVDGERDGDGVGGCRWPARRRARCRWRGRRRRQPEAARNSRRVSSSSLSCGWMFEWVGLGASSHGCLAVSFIRFGLRRCHMSWDAAVQRNGYAGGSWP